MAVRRLKGLYLKSEGKYLEDYPSCYVEQTEALFEWRQSTPKQDIELHKRAEKFSGLFRDMLLDKDAIENVKLFEDAAFFCSHSVYIGPVGSKFGSTCPRRASSSPP